MKNVKSWIILAIFMLVGSLCGRGCGQMMSQRYSNASSAKIHTAEILPKVMRNLKENNELIRLLLEKDPNFEGKLKKDLEKLVQDPALVSAFQRNQSLSADDFMEHMPSLFEEVGHYLYMAPDEEFYNSFYLEYQHLKKNNCRIYPLPLADQQETARVKSQAVLAALKNPYAFKPLSEEQFSNLLEKVLQGYKAKGYNVSHFAMYWGMKPGRLTSQESCQVIKGLYESIFSMPQKEAVLFWRMVLYMGNEGQ